MAKYDKVHLRIVDLTQQGTAAADQAGREFGVRGIPDIRIFGRNGQEIDHVIGADLARIEAAVQKGLQ